MNNSAQQPKRPSQKFIETLEQMARERDVSFVYPSTVAEAKKQFRTLKARPKADRRDQRREDRVVRAAVARGGYAAGFDDEELGGYGPTAHFT
jgi:hypothetical protein